MTTMILESLFFMDKMKRIRETAKIEGFNEYVTESSTIKITDDYGSKEFKYIRESFINDMTDLASDVPTRARIKKLFTTVVSESLDYDTWVKKAIILMDLPMDKRLIVIDNIMVIERQRLVSGLITDETIVNDYGKLLALCAVIDDCCSEVSIDNHKKDISYLKLAAETISGSSHNDTTHPLNYAVTLKLSVLRDKIEACGSETVKKIFKDARESKGTFTIESTLNLVKNDDGDLSKYLMGRKNKIDSEIDIILLDKGNKPYTQGLTRSSSESSMFKIVPTVIQSLKGDLSLDRLKLAFCRAGNTSVELNSIDIFMHRTSFPTYAVEQCVTAEGEHVWIASNNKSARILLKDVNTSDLLYVKLVENCILHDNLEIVLGSSPVEDSGHKIHRVKYIKPSNIDLDSVTEGIKFTEDGGVKLTYKPVGTYMDDYSRINKVLVQNNRNGNTEGMKTDLVYLFSFIDELEKITKGKVRVNDGIKKDAVKARMFAIGDFKRYLAIVQEADPMFNFSKHFEENFKDEAKVMIEFSNADIKGFKKLLRTIMGY